jgi:hypothetical protein
VATEHRVRRWLQLGAASAGVSAALLGAATLASDIAAAAAETESESVTAAAPNEPESTPDESAAADAQAEPEPEPDAEEPEPDDDELEPEDNEHDPDDEPEPDDDEPEPDDDEAEQEPEAEPGDELTDETTAAPASTQPWAVQTSNATSKRQQEVAGQIDAFTASTRDAIASLPVAAPVQEALTGTLFTLRRALLNQAPVVTSVVQFSGSANTPVQARVDAVDPDGDRIVYRLVQGPKSGTVQVNSDGSYMFTPGSDFNGVDTFVVAAYDTGLHLNLLDLFRAPATMSNALVNQGAVRFDFDYTSGAQYWTPERRAALNAAADQFGAYFLVTAPRVLTFTVTGMEDAETSTLASAESFPVYTEDEGVAEVVRTVLQHKLITGEDDNGAAADGRITWNFAQPWGLGATTGEDEFDFTAVAIHELMHSVGFVSVIGAPGTNEDSDWTVFDSFVATADGTKVIRPDLTWNTAYDANLLGRDGGLYFTGANAVAAQGGPVRLYTPTEFLPGSSLSHLSQRVFEGKIMVPISSLGPRSRDLSALELGILQDIGFTVVTPLLVSA